MSRPAPNVSETATARDDDQRQIIGRNAGNRITLITHSFRQLTGNELVPATPDVANALWSAPIVVLAHGTEADPVFFYGNRAALDIFEIGAEEFIRLPSRFSAEPLLREDRARLLERVTRENYISDYAGVRIARTGKRFRIEQATVWNLIDRDGAIHGQAAAFDRWIPLD